METVIVKESMRSDWEKFVAENPRTIAWQSFDWSLVLKKFYKFDFYPIAVYDGKNICGILPLYRMKTDISGDFLMSVPYAVAGGIAADNEQVRKALLGKAIDLSEQFDACRVILKQYKYQVEGDLAVDDNYHNRELRLSTDLDEVWNCLEEVNKRKIEEMSGNNLMLDYPSQDISGFYEMLLKHLHARGIPCVRRGWVEDLLACKMYSIALLKEKGVIVAGTMVKEFKQTVSFPFTCLSQRVDESYAYKLYWELIRLFSLSGKEIFHSGRIPNNNLTDNYRMGWGGTRYGYYYQYYPNTQQKTEFSNRRGRKRDLFEKCWKMVPTPMAGALGPYIVKQFP